MNDPLPIPRVETPFDVAITPPGSKSVTNRAYVLAALADGASAVARPLRADDTDALLDSFASLGAAVGDDGDLVTIDGVGGRFPQGGSVNLGDGGTPVRFMMAAACLADGEVVVDGSARMRERPVAGLVDLLRAVGAEIDYVEEEGRLPIRTTPAALRGGMLELGELPSSQYVSALMLVAPLSEDGIELRFEQPVTSRSYVDLTAAVIRAWGGEVELDANALRIAPQTIRGRAIDVPPDASSAVYWWTAAALFEGARATTPGSCGPIAQPDEVMLDRLAALGADVDPPAVRGAALHGGVTLDMAMLPDAALALAAASARAEQPVHITGLKTLRVKETDRIAALATELGKVGCRVDATDESLTIDPSGVHDDPVTIGTYNDHRMAMAFAVLGLARGGISIENPACVSKSYPGFWDDLAVITT